MTSSEFRGLTVGDSVQQCVGRKKFLVSDRHGTRVTIARTIDVKNLPEWRKIRNGLNPIRRISELRPGDILTFISTLDICVVASVHGDHATAVETTEISRADVEEWEIVTKTGRRITPA